MSKTIEYHCGMCEHDWRARSAKRCPNCGTDEFETLDKAKTHNAWVIEREGRVKL